MSQPNQEMLDQFNKIISKLSNEDKKKLYERLKVMSPEERNVAIVKIVNHYSANKVLAAPAPAMDETPKVTIPKPVEPSSVEVNKNEVNEAPKEKPKAQENAPAVSKPKQKKRLKKPVKVALTLFVTGLILIAAAIAIFVNRDKFDSLINPNSSEVVSSETSDAVAPSDEATNNESDVTETTIAETTESAEPTPTPGPTNVPVLPGAPDLTGLVVVLDPGHQAVADDEAEVCAPWLNISKPRCTAGATGTVTGTPEYDLTLQYCLIFKNYLEQCGATVILTRETNDVNMSNQERAQFALDHNADVFIRVHCDNFNDSSASGVRVYVPDTGDYTGSNIELGNQLGTMVAEAEGLTFDEAHATYLYTGLNYANTIQCFQISLGYLSNSENEAVLLNPDNELNVAEVIADFCELFL